MSSPNLHRKSLKEAEKGCKFPGLQFNSLALSQILIMVEVDRVVSIAPPLQIHMPHAAVTLNKAGVLWTSHPNHYTSLSYSLFIMHNERGSSPAGKKWYIILE